MALAQTSPRGHSARGRDRARERPLALRGQHAACGPEQGDLLTEDEVESGDDDDVNKNDEGFRGFSLSSLSLLSLVSLLSLSLSLSLSL